MSGEPWFVYVAEAHSGRFYVGMSNDVASRIAAHNAGKGAKMAIRQGPFVLRFVSRPFDTKAAARKREAQIKRWSREKKQKLIDGEWS